MDHLQHLLYHLPMVQVLIIVMLSEVWLQLEMIANKVDKNVQANVQLHKNKSVPQNMNNSVEMSMNK